MKTPRYAFFFLMCWAVATLLLAGCRKEESGPTTVSGQVVEAASRQAVPRPPSVQVWGREQSSSNSLLSSRAYHPVGNAQPTDAQGRFSFSFEAAPKHDYVLRADQGGLGYYTDWNLTPTLQGGKKNENLRLPVYAPCWVRLDLVDEAPRSRVVFYFSGFGGGGHSVPYPRDTTLYFRYLTGDGQETFIYWRITPNGVGQEVTDSRTFIQPPLDTQRIRIPF